VALADVLGKTVTFVDDSTGPLAHEAVDAMRNGDVVLLENTRYHPGEESNDPALAQEFAALADIFVHDAFSAAHRAHASTEGVGLLLPSYAGRLMQAELEALDAALGNPVRPVAAIVGGSKVSTKLELLGNLVGKVDVLVIGGAMANTFLAAQGISVGKSLQEADMHEIAREILVRAKAAGCEIVLPLDAVVSVEFRANPPTQTVPVGAIPPGTMMLDVGPATVADLVARLPGWRTLVWNGPLGAFETPPFDTATTALALAVADATEAGTLRSVAGGGDTVSALKHAGVMERMSYVSAAGGAFLEWLEGKTLPGVAILMA
jgi:phosphoglycerate kinase